MVWCSSTTVKQLLSVQRDVATSLLTRSSASLSRATTILREATISNCCEWRVAGDGESRLPIIIELLQLYLKPSGHDASTNDEALELCSRVVFAVGAFESS